MASQRPWLAIGRIIVDVNRAVPRSDCQFRAIGGPGQRPGAAGAVAVVSLLFLAGHAPDPDAVVPTGGSQPLAIRSEGESAHPIVVSEKAAALFSRCQVPQLNGSIVSSGGQDATIGAIRQAANRRRMTRKDVHSRILRRSEGPFTLPGPR